ncbi:HNH endonuclease [Corallococcus sp. AB004]|nr:HNH endonuclease [Corallococcus sp. AB004]
MIDATRTATSPKSLDSKKSYSGEDVRDQLFLDYLGKCYLCEGLITRGGFEIDHRHPCNDGGAEHTWLNLFPACRICNGARKRKYPSGGLLNPGEHPVEVRLHQYMSSVGGHELPHFKAATINDLAAANTAHELQELHQEKGERSADLCSAITRYINEVRKKALALYDAREIHGPNSLQFKQIESELQRMVSRKAPYTALVRSCLAVSPIVRALFD